MDRRVRKTLPRQQDACCLPFTERYAVGLHPWFPDAGRDQNRCYLRRGAAPDIRGPLAGRNSLAIRVLRPEGTPGGPIGAQARLPGGSGAGRSGRQQGFEASRHRISGCRADLLQDRCRRDPYGSPGRSGGEADPAASATLCSCAVARGYAIGSAGAPARAGASAIGGSE
jgi:hypothetical protein